MRCHGVLIDACSVETITHDRRPPRVVRDGPQLQFDVLPGPAPGQHVVAHHALEDRMHRLHQRPSMILPFIELRRLLSTLDMIHPGVPGQPERYMRLRVHGVPDEPADLLRIVALVGQHRPHPGGA